MSFNGFSLVPADDPGSSAQDALDAAIAGASSPAVTPALADPPVPFGRSWRFDFATGQFVRLGQSPAETSHFDTLAQWCLMAIHTARYAHPVFSDDFGMEAPDSLIGEIAVGEALADWQRHLIDALLVHDRIATIQNVRLRWEPTEGVLYIDAMDIVTDEDETLTLSDVALLTGGA